VQASLHACHALLKVRSRPSPRLPQMCRPSGRRRTWLERPCACLTASSP
jgi:hypothetical protein